VEVTEGGVGAGIESREASEEPSPLEILQSTNGDSPIWKCNKRTKYEQGHYNTASSNGIIWNVTIGDKGDEVSGLANFALSRACF